MKNVIIFGAGIQGSRLKRILEQTGEYKVCYFCDNNHRKQNEILNGVKIISMNDMEVLSKEGFKGILIIAVYKQRQVIEQIQENGEIHFPVYGVAWEYIMQNRGIDEILYFIDIKKPYFDYFEYHVSDHCNLKCRGCGHYSNVAEPHFGDLEKYIRDLKRLKELFCGIEIIRLMGGEPLLNKNLPDFIFWTRNIFPDSDIMVVTNGLLIPQIEEKVLETMSKYFVRFDISLYPPTQKIKEKIELRCIENDVNYHFSTPINEFYDCMNYNGDSNKYIAYEKCKSNHCHFLEEGKISVCSMPILYKNQRKKLLWEMCIGENDIIDLYDPNLDGYKLKEFLSKPMEVCRYCSDGELKYFEWQGNYPYCEKFN